MARKRLEICLSNSKNMINNYNFKHRLYLLTQKSQNSAHNTTIDDWMKKLKLDNLF